MIDIKSQKEIGNMKEGGKILAEILASLKNFSREGINTSEIDSLAEKLMKKYKVIASFKNFRGYKYATCLSVNEEVVHGIPGRHILKRGDIFSIDAGVYHKGLHTDSAITFAIDKASTSGTKLLEVAYKSLMESAKLIAPGIKLGTIQASIQKIIEDSGYRVIKDLSGHGIGKKLQEEPQIPNYGKLDSGIVLKEGMTFCLEPMVSTGSSHIKVDSDGWTVSTLDNALSAHFEHTIAVTDIGYEILTKK